MFFPYLKYIHITGDLNGNVPAYVHDQIYIGGATSAAKRYGLKALPNEFFEQIDKLNNIKELTTLIRSYYPD